MKRAETQLKDREVGRLLGIFAALVLTIVVMILVSSWQSVAQISAATEARNRLAVAAAISRETTDLAEYVTESDDWDDEFVEERQAAPRSAETPIEGDGKFDEVWLLGRDLSIHLEFRSEDLVEQQVHRQHRQASVVLRDRLRSSQPPTVADIFAESGTPTVYAMAALPEGSQFVSEYPGLRGGFILAHKSLGAGFLTEVAGMMQLASVRLAPSANDDASVPVRNRAGTTIGHVAWDPENPTLAIIASRFPATIIFAGLIAVIGLFLIRQAATSFRTLNRQARFDPLSRLPNRAAMMLQLRMLPATAPLSALALLDLDGFKTINDHHGHQLGDAVIRHMAATLRARFVGTAYIARLGGDEFALLFTSMANAREASAQCELLLDELKRPVDVSGHTLKLGVSIGLAYFDGSVRAAEALRRADIAMYAAKQHGKMQLVEFSSSLDQKRLFALDIKDQLIGAIANSEITIKYQPIICARTGHIAALEALVRWQSPTRGNIRADEFVPVAEEFGLIGALGDHIIDLVLADLPRLPDVRIAMNVSAAQITSFDFASKFAAALRAAGVEGDRFEIEVTETSLLRNAEPLHLAMHTLGQLGVRHILDDFGSGYASIGFLRRFPFAAVKVDRSILADCDHSARSRSILMAIVTLAHTHDMEVIAEGVETIEQADIARTVGCDYLQGWLYSRAVTVDELGVAGIYQTAGGSTTARPRAA